VSDHSAEPSPDSESHSAILWTDGAARGNPGPAGIGVMLKTRSGRVIVAEGRSIGHATNNVAEYRALLLGLEKALERGIRRVEVRADSELLIKQLRNEYRVKNPGLRPLFEQAAAMIRRFETVRLTHVRREHNSEADRLANEGIDNAKGPGSDAS
jgi:ribonuclease HI